MTAVYTVYGNVTPHIHMVRRVPLLNSVVEQCFYPATSGCIRGEGEMKPGRNRSKYGRPVFQWCRGYT